MTKTVEEVCAEILAENDLHDVFTPEGLTEFKRIVHSKINELLEGVAKEVEKEGKKKKLYGFQTSMNHSASIIRSFMSTKK